jgi:hypothetical protein
MVPNNENPSEKEIAYFRFRRDIGAGTMLYEVALFKLFRS